MDKEYDVVILGSGASGMMSAITAYENGSSVGLFEKQSLVGGTAGVSGGIIWAPMNSHMKAKGIEDDRNKAIDYFMSLSHGDINLNLLEAFIDNCAEALDFLENKTDAKFSILEGYPDYYLDRPGAIEGGGRALDNNLFDYSILGEWATKIRNNGSPLPMTLGETPLGGGTGIVSDNVMAERLEKDSRGFGQALVGALLKGCLDRDIEPQLNTKTKINNKLNSISKNIIFSNSGEAIILKNNNTKGIVLRGYKRNDLLNLEVLTNEKFKGELNQFDKNSISIGSELSFSLDLEIGDELTLMSPSGVQTIIGSMPKQKTFVVNSIFNSGLAEFDNNIAFIELNVLEEFFGYNPDERNLEIYLKNPNNIESQKLIVKQVFDDEFVFSWADMNSSLFSALKVERNVMFIILSLIIIVAAFNIISGLTILVKNKTRDIAILKSIGVLNKSIIKIFFLVGVIIGTSATIFGIFLGVTFSIYIENFRQFLSSVFNISLFPEEIYFLSKMPSEINPTSIILISVCSIIITILVSIFPAFKAARLDPIKSLKYE